MTKEDGTPTDPQGATSGDNGSLDVGTEVDETKETDKKPDPGNTDDADQESAIEKMRRETDRITSKKDAQVKRAELLADKVAEVGLKPDSIETLKDEDSEMADEVAQKLWGMTAEEVITSRNAKPDDSLSEEQKLARVVDQAIRKSERSRMEKQNQKAAVDVLATFQKDKKIKEGSDEDLAVGKAYKEIIDDIPLVKRTPQKIQTILNLALTSVRGKGEEEGAEEDLASVNIGGSRGSDISRSKHRLSKEEKEFCKNNGMDEKEYAKYKNTDDIPLNL